MTVTMVGEGPRRGGTRAGAVPIGVLALALVCGCTGGAPRSAAGPGGALPAAAVGDVDASTGGARGRLGTLVFDARWDGSPDELGAVAAIYEQSLRSRGFEAVVGVRDAVLHVEIRNEVIADAAHPAADTRFAPHDVDVAIRPVRSCAPDATAGGSDGERVPTLDGGACVVGPPAATGAAFRPDVSAVVTDGGQWAIVVSLRDGSDRSAWNALTAACAARATTCPDGQLALEVGGVIVTTPTVNQPSFTGTLRLPGPWDGPTARRVAADLLAAATPRVTIESATWTPNT